MISEVDENGSILGINTNGYQLKGQQSHIGNQISDGAYAANSVRWFWLRTKGWAVHRVEA